MESSVTTNPWGGAGVPPMFFLLFINSHHKKVHGGMNQPPPQKKKKRRGKKRKIAPSNLMARVHSLLLQRQPSGREHCADSSSRTFMKETPSPLPGVILLTKAHASPPPWRPGSRSRRAMGMQAQYIDGRRHIYCRLRLFFVKQEETPGGG